MKIRLGISESIQHWARYTPDKQCILSENLAFSYRQLDCAIEWFANLISSRYGTGACVPVIIEDKPLLFAIIVACIRCGNYPSIINPNLSLKEFKHVLAELSENKIVVESKCNALLTESYDCYKVSQETLLLYQDYKQRSHWKTPNLEDPWGILYSSGTTGIPKGIIRSHFSILTELLGWLIELETRKSSHYYIGRPVFYTGGLVITLTAILVGGTVSMPNAHDENMYLSHCKKYKIDLSFLIPSQIQALVRYVEQEDIKHPPNARFILSMGAAFPSDLKAHAMEVLHSGIIESWGNTEGLGTITLPDDVKTRPDSIGRPFLTDDLFIIGEQGQKVNQKEVGRLSGIVDSKFTDYKNSEFLTTQHFSDDTIISEDLGYENEDGYFYLLGRVGDMFIYKGHKIYPISLEKVIASLDAVEEVSVVGIKVGDEGYIPVAFIKSSKIEASDHKTLDFINSKLEESERIRFIKIIDQFPKTASGKIKKEELRLMYTDEIIAAFRQKYRNIPVESGQVE